MSGIAVRESLRHLLGGSIHQAHRRTLDSIPRQLVVEGKLREVRIDEFHQKRPNLREMRQEQKETNIAKSCAQFRVRQPFSSRVFASTWRRPLAIARLELDFDNARHQRQHERCRPGVLLG